MSCCKVRYFGVFLSLFVLQGLVLKRKLQKLMHVGGSVFGRWI